MDQIFSDQVAELFSKIVSLAEKAGKHVELLVVPERDYNRATVDVAQQLQSMMGLSAKMTPSEQAKAFGDAWELLRNPRPQLSLEILDQQNQKQNLLTSGPIRPALGLKTSNSCTGYGWSFPVLGWDTSFITAT